MKKLFLAAALIVMAGPALAEEAMKTTVVKPDALTWRDNPVLPKGAQVAVLVGDPTKAGEIFVQRVKFPPNYTVPPHTHPYFETVTVITGTLGSGMGEKLDKEKGEMLKAGSLFALPANHPHYVWTTNEETIVQVQATGPVAFNYVNPADDPRKK